MLFMMSGMLCLSALPCSVCGIGTLPCLVLLTTPCSFHDQIPYRSGPPMSATTFKLVSAHSATLWG